VALAKKEPDKLAYASSGNGSHVHVATEYLLYTAKIKITHVPYKGTGPALNDTIGGKRSDDPGQRRDGPAARQIRAPESARGHHAQAHRAAPTSHGGESGYPTYEVTNWHGLVGPKATVEVHRRAPQQGGE